MTLTIPINILQLSPGSTVTIPNLSWQDFEILLTELPEKRSTRIIYYQGFLEIMSPLAIHERPHRIIASIITAILDFQDRDWENFGSTTLKCPDIAGVEPDTCFYIQNADQIKGCSELNLSIHPPPDLAIESDVSSRTTLDAYEAIQVPEIWIYRNQKLTIYVYSKGHYSITSVSPTFPDIPLLDLIPIWVQTAISMGTRQMLKEVRDYLKQQ